MNNQSTLENISLQHYIQEQQQYKQTQNPFQKQQFSRNSKLSQISLSPLSHTYDIGNNQFINSYQVTQASTFYKQVPQTSKKSIQKVQFDKIIINRYDQYQDQSEFSKRSLTNGQNSNNNSDSISFPLLYQQNAGTQNNNKQLMSKTLQSIKSSQFFKNQQKNISQNSQEFKNEKVSKTELNSNITSPMKQLQQLSKQQSEDKQQPQSKSQSQKNLIQSFLQKRNSIIEDEDQTQGRTNLIKNEKSRLKSKAKINLKMIQKIIEKDMEKKLSSKQKAQFKIHKDIAAAILESKQYKEQQARSLSQLRFSQIRQNRAQQDQQKQFINEVQNTDMNQQIENMISERDFNNNQTLSDERTNLKSPMKVQVSIINDQKAQKHDNQNLKRSFKSAAQVNSFLQLQAKIHKIQSNQNKIRASVTNELDKREICSPVNYLQKRISNYFEAEQHKEFQLTFDKKAQQLELERQNQIKAKKFQLLPFPLQSDQAEFRNVNMLFSKKEEDQIITLKTYHDNKSPSNKLKNQLLNHKNFDFNKYKVVSPFQKSRNSLNIQPNGFLSPQRKHETILQQQHSQIDNILKKCNYQHNLLAKFAKRQGNKIQKRYEYLEQNQESVLRQIDVAKDMLFMDLCKRQKFREKFRDLINKSLNEDWVKIAQDMTYDYQTKQLLEFFQGKYSLDMLSNVNIREELWKQIEDYEMEIQKIENESLAEHDSFHHS